MRQDLYDRIVDYIVENQDKFYRLAYSYVHNKEDALDIVQSAVLKALDPPVPRPHAPGCGPCP